MAQSIREADAKRILKSFNDVLASDCVQISSETDLETITDSHPWLTQSNLVVKPDVLLKRRGKSGLVKLDVDWNAAKQHLKDVLNTEHKVPPLTGTLTHFIVEPFVTHDAETEEYYIAMRPERLFDEIIFYHQGGVNVGDVESKASKLKIPIHADGTVEKIQFGSLFDNVTDAVVKAALPGYVQALYECFSELHFAFLEINPFTYKGGRFYTLDVAAKLDHTAEFVCEKYWGGIEFPTPFGRFFTPSERYIRELDAKTGASLKLTVVNPKGRVWTMVAGGGSSVIYADTVCDLGMSSELSNYGEYSGAPSEISTFEYAKTILQLMTAPGTFRDEGKILLIGGGIANFTSVADTFRGIVRALTEFQKPLKDYKVRIYVRRGGPGYEEGLRMMRDVGQKLGLPMKVYGPETYLTEIIKIAIEDDSRIRQKMQIPISDSPKSTFTATPSEFVETGVPSPSAGGSPKEVPVFPVTTKMRHKDLILYNDIRQQVLSQLHEELHLGPMPSVPMKAQSGEDEDEEPMSQPALFSKQTKCFVYGLQVRAVQEMLDFDYVSGRKIPSVTAMIYEFSPSHTRSFYFGTDEVFIPVYQSLKEAVEKHQDVDCLVNFASMRSAAEVTREAIKTPQFKTLAVIAEGVPERHTREIIQSANEHHKVLIGPATVGGIRAGCFRVGNTGGRLENIMNARLYRAGGVGFVTKSGGMLNELNNILRHNTDGTCEGVAIGGDRFPGTTLLEHLLRYERDPRIKMLAMLGEVGGGLEHEVARALKQGLIRKPLVAWCVGTCATAFTTEVSFGHAGAWAGSDAEHASAKNAALKAAGAFVPNSFQGLGEMITTVYNRMVQANLYAPVKEPEVPRAPLDYAYAKKQGLVRRPKHFMTTISDDRGEEVLYAGHPISRILQADLGVGGVLSLLWFKKALPVYCYRYLERVLMLVADHGPAVSGAMNTIVTARAGKDLVSSLIAGLCTIGNRFGGACDQAAQMFLGAYEAGYTPEDFVKNMKQKGKLIMGIGHKIKSVHNPDMRVQLLKEFCKKNFYRTTLIDYALEVEKVTTKKKDTLILNVDGLIGVSMVDMLMGCGAFNTAEARELIEMGCINGLFVLGRSMGFIGHFLDQKRLKMGLYRHDQDDIAYVLPKPETSL